jgi:hypothetical protein
VPNPFCSINVRKYRRGNQNFIIQRNWQQVVHRTTKNKLKTQHNMCWTPLYANKHKEREYYMNTPTAAGITYHVRPPELIPGFFVGSVLLIFLVFFNCTITCLYVLCSVLCCRLRYLHKNDVRFVFTYSCL